MHERAVVNETDSAQARWCSVAEAASELGIPERSIYRRIATQDLKARRDGQGALLVQLTDVESDVEAAAHTPAAVTSGGLTAQRARALTEFASGLVEPLIQRLSQQDTIIREQAEELGRLRTRLELGGEAEDRLAPAFARQMAELAAIREEIEVLARRRRLWPFS